MFMSNITIPKIEYENLKERAVAYERMIQVAQVPFSLTPIETSRKKVMASFKKIDKYNKAFLSSLSSGLKRSTYFKA